ncbi:MAG: hypothetical protein EP307_02765 [Rhodobacteraceae bacterium]|nr:MAG: hypothetical protein EP307_02765 [Paracoccaceae bacterium]
MFELTKIALTEGVWQGVLTRIEGAAEPRIDVRHLDRPVKGVTLQADGGGGRWMLRIPIPAVAIADGVQTFTIREAETDTDLGSFTLIAGEALADDIRAEVDLLRAELDMLKRAFRRHCLETR